MSTASRIILLNKESGVTSFTALNKVKKTFGRKVGHAGTLDKFAQGLLIVLTGAMTKLNPLFSSMDKSYRAHILFGSETDTLDPEGRVIATGEIPSFEAVREAIQSFDGEMLQTPPIYSALHVGGKRASALARKGKPVELESRPIRIDSFEVVSYEDGILIADIRVSKGTYIRSIARDLGLAVSSRAHLVALVRTSIGPFALSEATEVDEHVDLTNDYLGRLEQMALATVSDDQLFPLANGRYPDHYDLMKEGSDYIAFYSGDGVLRAVGNKTKRRLIAQVYRGGAV
ncbi:MAG: tRNA pseudouridine synthase B [Spirochaetes bacterium ADurb.Bin315]|nr:MAG: tRNA pseudouridine synthase B [Spirochaetes bacterium ADurb.Bin315]HOR79920.1 tRNA pseudouridine(55) synthase TruB [Sphaerochaeta sp.]